LNVATFANVAALIFTAGDCCCFCCRHLIVATLPHPITGAGASFHCHLPLHLNVQGGIKMQGQVAAACHPHVDCYF